MAAVEKGDHEPLEQLLLADDAALQPLQHHSDVVKLGLCHLARSVQGGGIVAAAHGFGALAILE